MFTLMLSVGMFILRRNELKPKAFSQGAPIMHFSKFAFQFSSPLEKRGFPAPLVNEYGTKVMASLTHAVKPLLLMHGIIESEYSACADGVPGALMAEIIIRKIQIMLASITLNHSIIQFSLLEHIYSFFFFFELCSVVFNGLILLWNRIQKTAERI